MSSGKIPVMEIFGPTIQGEGLMTGTVTHFIRTGGCGLRCAWCDTMFAVDPKQVRAGRTMMTTGEIITKISNMPYAPYVTLTGGDPCLHKDLGDIIYPLNMHRVRIAVETQGSLFPDWLANADVVTFSPKPFSSGNVVDVEGIYEWLAEQGGPRRNMQVCIKVVVFDERDLEYAMQVLEYIPETHYDSFYLSAGTTIMEQPDLSKEIMGDQEVLEAHAMRRLMNVIESQRHLADKIISLAHHHRFNTKFHIGCQQHVVLWPEVEQGV